ncbi:MAG TPA: AAA-associated domain-containing protein, partial [Pirellulaceae bacterium]|nr:AAA-associated domain-containing protein [Pirellulaceae bacterium]
RPRDYRAPEFLALVDELHDVIMGHELPEAGARDIASTAAPLASTASPADGTLLRSTIEKQSVSPVGGSTTKPTGADDVSAAGQGGNAATIEALPEATVSEIIGLLEYLDARGGSEDLFRIASDTRREFGHMLNIVEAAELLNLVDTPKRLVVLDETGREFLAADADRRKPIWREQLLKLQLFRQLQTALQRASEQGVDRQFVFEMIVLDLPNEHYERIFETLVRWGRFGKLLAYDDATGHLSAGGGLSS